MRDFSPVLEVKLVRFYELIALSDIYPISVIFLI